ncbi:MAG: ornithine carbamoyltransferase [Myxococcota bacterium]
MHYLTERDLSPAETKALLVQAKALKAERKRNVRRSELLGRHVALYFEKPSVRTRVSFSVAVRELGGEVVELSPQNTKVGHGEELEDFAKVLGRYAHAIVARVFLQDNLQIMAEAAGVPVVNALSDDRHPCQALADALTIEEHLGAVEGKTIAFIGEGNNVAASLAGVGVMLGAEVRVAAPRGRGLAPVIRAECAAGPGRLIELEDPLEAAAGADVLYTDTWVSMGKEGDASALKAQLSRYRIDEAALAKAKGTAIVMHCLPAVRGEEISREIMHGPRSAIWDQAENRLHAQKALLLRLLGASSA